MLGIELGALMSCHLILAMEPSALGITNSILMM